MKTTSTNEKELQAEVAPWPETMAELTEYIQSLEALPADYGMAVYVASLSAAATLNYLGKTKGMTGFQMSCVDLDILRRMRGLDCPFMIIKAHDMLYPQYDIAEQVAEALNKWRPWAIKQATVLLMDARDGVHPAVLARWKEFANLKQ